MKMLGLATTSRRCRSHQKHFHVKVHTVHTTSTIPVRDLVTGGYALRFSSPSKYGDTWFDPPNVGIFANKIFKIWRSYENGWSTWNMTDLICPDWMRTWSEAYHFFQVLEVFCAEASGSLGQLKPYKPTHLRVSFDYIAGLPGNDQGASCFPWDVRFQQMISCSILNSSEFHVKSLEFLWA